MMTIAGLMLAMVANAQNFVLKGTVKGNVEGCTVMLQKYDIDKVSNLDSATITKRWKLPTKRWRNFAEKRRRQRLARALPLQRNSSKLTFLSCKSCKPQA